MKGELIMKKTLALLVSAILLIGMYGGMAVAGQAKTIITVTRWGEVSANDPEKMIIDKFNAENTLGIEVVYDVVPGDGYGDRLTTSFSSGEGYDIFASGEGDYYKWVDKSLARPLDDLIAADETWVNEMAQSIYDMGNINGQQYYLTRDYNPLCLWYNKSVFDKNGVAYPTDDWTWDDLVAAAEKLTIKNADGTYESFGFNAQSWTYAVLTYLQSQGIEILSPDGTTVDGYINSPEVAAAMEKYVAMSVGEVRISPSAADLDTFGNATAMFVNGNLAMTINGGWMKSELDAANTNYSTALVPGNHQEYLCASAYAIGSRCRNPEAAWEVIKALTGAECTELKVRYSAVLPTIDSQLETLKSTIGDAAQGLIASLEYGVQPVGLRSKVGNPAAAAFDTAMQRMIFGDGATEQIFDDAVEEVAEKLAE
jgi:multiple sugar transport system substrate-binding protein